MQVDIKTLELELIGFKDEMNMDSTNDAPKLSLSISKIEGKEKLSVQNLTFKLLDIPLLEGVELTYSYDEKM
jgi:hypothetical protein